MKKLGDYIRNLRKQKKLSMLVLSKTLKMSIGTYGAIERGQITPDRNQLSKICNYFEIDSKKFLTDVFGESEFTQRMIEILISISPSNIAKTQSNK